MRRTRNAASFMKAVSKHTSNRHPENVLTNCFLRLQVHDDWDENIGSIQKNEKNEISKHAELLKPRRKNTLFSFHLLEKYPKAWQCHLQRIPDFLQMKAWQEVAEGIMFHDHDDVIDFPRPHHFRSSSLKKEYVELKRIWNALDNSPIPSFVKIFDCGKQMKLKSLRFSEFVDLDGIFEESFGELVDESEDEGRDEPSDKEISDEELQQDGEGDFSQLAEPLTSTAKSNDVEIQDVSMVVNSPELKRKKSIETSITPSGKQKSDKVLTNKTPTTPFAALTITTDESCDTPCCSKSLAMEMTSTPRSAKKNSKKQTCGDTTNQKSRGALNQKNKMKRKKTTVLSISNMKQPESKTANYMEEMLGNHNILDNTRN
ncbi:uncharacterized protein [Clytia hemisphaerica]|uniref:uncharacterized protein n=1 Tax=Clytia hemisphaerica TaxID=252671 RepID=UPI0034D52638